MPQVENVIKRVDEIWRPIKDYESLYEISSLGHIRILPKHGHPKSHLIKTPSNWFVCGGYCVARLIKGGKQKLFRVSRLVANHFIVNPNNKPQVNHKDGVKTNDCTNNLEWVNNSENQLHAYKTGLQKFTPERLEKQRVSHLGQIISKETRRKISLANKGRKFPKEFGKKISERMKGRTFSEQCLKKLSKPVYQMDLSGNIIREWYGMSEAARSLGLSVAKISVCCKGKRNKHGNFKWKLIGSDSSCLK